ncbi:hypothetical protein C9374_003166 [Naegleria lovaniensis]|uniref:Uncharacterized protein n=1 Tax=Naegleria lovaniensis TaxID=51637 RepID=A0AA88GNQ4_NAELO|nr:uncharacterized protein C9374_003166 [Naegleria lovaniensis]KAG2386017.1 hypothetical protein C9374_003166 [Naegleria lovaniensis]
MAKFTILALVLFAVYVSLAPSSEELIKNANRDPIPARFDNWYSVNSLSYWLEYELSSPSNTKLSFTFNEANMSEPFPDFNLKTNELNAALYQHFPFPESSNNLTMLGLFNVTFSSSEKRDENAITFLNVFLFRGGILNTYANTVRYFIFNGTHFVDPPNKILSTGLSGFEWNHFKLENQSIIFGVFGYQFKPQFNLQILVPGPRDEEITPYFSLNDYTPSAKNEMPYGYIALRSLQYIQSTNPAPVLGRQRWYFMFNSSQGFTDVNGQVVSIHTSSLKCACAKDTNSRLATMWYASVSDNQLTCENSGICNYFAVVAKSSVAPSPSVSSAVVTPLTIGSTIQDTIHSISQKKYYKIDMFPNTKVNIKASSAEGIGILYINAYSIPKADSFDEKLDLTSGSSSVIVNNYLSEVKEVFLLIEPTTSSLSFSISTTSQDIHFHEPLGPGAIIGIAVGSSVFAMCMKVLLVLVALVIVYKGQKKHRAPDSVYQALTR